MVPEGWKRASGEDIAEKITKGQSPKWQGFDYQDHGTLFVTSENVREGYLDISKPKYLPIAFNKKLKGSQLRKGDLLINIVGASIGRSCMFDLDVEHANINQAVCLFRTNPQVRSEYIIQYLQLPTTIDKLLGTQTESARPNLSLGDMRGFLFLVPPLPEQKKIAKILSTWDQAITATERLLENSQQRKKALMQQLLTRKKRLPGFEGEWETKPIAQTGKIVSGGTPDTNNSDLWGGGVQWLTPTDITALKTHFIYNTPRKLTEKGVKESSATLIPTGSICVCTRASVGLMAMSTTPITTNQGFKSVVPNDEHDGEFLYYLFSFNRHIFVRYSSGSTFMELSKKDFAKIIFDYPPLVEQKAIACVLNSANCRVPDDHMNYRSYPLLAARELLQSFIREQADGHQTA